MSIFSGLVDFGGMATWRVPTIGFKPTVDVPSAQLRLLVPRIPILHVAMQPQRMPVALRAHRHGDGDIRNPVLTPAVCSLFNTFAIKIRLEMLEKSWRDALQSMDIDHRIEATINLTGHDRGVFALLADKKLSGSGSERMPSKLRRVVDVNLKRGR